jgi:PKD repeat protein
VTLVAQPFDQQVDVFSWNLGDGRTASGPEVVTSFAEPGVYRASLQANVAGQPTGEPYERWLVVTDPNVNADFNQIDPVAFFNRPQQGDMFAVGETVVFQGHGTDGDGQSVSLYWDLGDGRVVEGSSTFETSYAFPGTFRPELYVVDEVGRAQFTPPLAEVHIYEGDVAPPDGVILEPLVNAFSFGTNLHEIIAGQAVTLRGTFTRDDTLEPYDAYWSVFTPSGENIFYEGAEIEPQVWEPGWYEVYFHTGHRLAADPIPAFVIVLVRDDNQPPFNVSISEPAWFPTIPPGGLVDFAGFAEDIEGDTITYSWSLSDGRTFEGERVQEVAFAEPGLHSVQMTATDSFGGSTPADVNAYVMVNPSDCGGVDFRFDRVFPEDLNLALRQGATIDFRAQVSSLTEGAVVAEVFWDFSHGITANGSDPAPVRFDEPGWYPVRIFARDNCGVWAFQDLYSIFVYGDNTPPTGEIVEPATNTFDSENAAVYATLPGTPITLQGTADDADGNFPLATSWDYNGIFHMIGDTPDPLVLNDPGLYDLFYRIQDSSGLDQPFAPSRRIVVVDPNLLPTVEIVLPEVVYVTEPGQPVAFEALGNDPNGLQLTYEWDFGATATAARTTGERVTGVVFGEPTEGDTVTVSVVARTLFTESAPATVQVRVVRIEDSQLEPNNGLEEATMLNAGFYGQLSLGPADPSDYYQFNVSEAGRDLAFDLQADGPVSIQLLQRQDDGSFTEVAVDALTFGETAFRLQNVDPGTYALAVAQPPGKQANNLSMSITLQTLNQTLYLPFVVHESNLLSEFGIINPNNGVQTVSLTAIDAQGNEVAASSLDIAGNGKLFRPAEAFFSLATGSNKARDIRWVRVRGSSRLIAYTNAASPDGTRLMSSAASDGLSADVLVPHIADPDAQWYTRAVVLNGSESSETLGFKSPEQQYDLNDNFQTDSVEDFRFSSRIEGDLPGWGTFGDGQPGSALAGVEMFGRTDQRATIAAIEMIDFRRRNNGFFSQTETLYYTHIAKDRDNWWTGISMININDVAVGYRMLGYNAAGVETFRSESTLAAGEKLLATATALFGEADVAWVKVEADGRLVGFELFGDPELARMAGFPAATEINDRLYFPHITEITPDNWIGISLLNVTEENVSMTIEAVGADGVVLAEAERELGPREKLVSVAQGFFDNQLPANTSYLRVTGNRKALCGFQLFGTLALPLLGDQLAGLSAIPF